MRTNKTKPMLTRDKIISIFCLIDDLFIGINHQEDIRRSVSDSEIAVTAIVSAIYFGGNQQHAIHFMKSYDLVPRRRYKMSSQALLRYAENLSAKRQAKFKLLVN